MSTILNEFINKPYLWTQGYQELINLINTLISANKNDYYKLAEEGQLIVDTFVNSVNLKALKQASQ